MCMDACMCVCAVCLCVCKSWKTRRLSLPVLAQALCGVRRWGWLGQPYVWMALGCGPILISADLWSSISISTLAAKIQVSS